MNDWIKGHEAIELLRCSQGKLRKLRDDGCIIWTKVGRTVYYSRTSIQGLFVPRKQKHTIKVA